MPSYVVIELANGANLYTVIEYQDSNHRTYYNLPLLLAEMADEYFGGLLPVPVMNGEEESVNCKLFDPETAGADLKWTLTEPSDESEPVTVSPAE